MPEDGHEFTPARPSPKPLWAIPTGLRGAHTDDEWNFDPRLGVRAEDLALVQLWFTCGGRDGLKLLPQTGGVLDQAALVMDAFAIVATAASAYTTMRSEE